MGTTAARAAAMNAQMTALAAAEGLAYQLDRAKPGNTFDAHRLLHLAAEHGLQAAAKERLMRAYFTEGLPVGDAGALAQIVSEVGVDLAEAQAVLAGTAYTHEVRVDERRAATFGIQGVPFAVVDEQYGVSGAQSPEIYLETLEQAWAASKQLDHHRGQRCGSRVLRW